MDAPRPKKPKALSTANATNTAKPSTDANVKLALSQKMKETFFSEAMFSEAYAEKICKGAFQENWATGNNNHGIK